MNLGFPAEEMKRLSACLARLVRHIRLDDVGLRTRSTG
jgi:hypothetical protein